MPINQLITTYRASFYMKDIIKIPQGYRKLYRDEVIPKDALFWNVYASPIVNDTTNVNLWIWHDPSIFSWDFVNSNGERITHSSRCAFIVKETTTPRGNRRV